MKQGRLRQGQLNQVRMTPVLSRLSSHRRQVRYRLRILMISSDVDLGIAHQETAAQMRMAGSARDHRLTFARPSFPALDRSELPLHVVFRADTNNDEMLSLEEVKAAHMRLQEKLFQPPTDEEIQRLPRPRLDGPRLPRPLGERTEDGQPRRDNRPRN